MKRTSDYGMFSGADVPLEQLLKPILANTLRFFEVEAAELVMSEQDRVLFLPELDQAPVEEGLEQTSFARFVVREDGVVEGEPGEAEKTLFQQYSDDPGSMNWSAGVPVYGREEQPSGAFVLVGNRDGTLTEREKGYLRDVSQQVNNHLQQAAEYREVESRCNMFELMLQEAYQFMGLVSEEGDVLFANKSSLEIIDAELEDLIGESLWLTPWFDHSEVLQEKIHEAVRTASSGEFVQLESSTISAEGKHLKGDFSITPVTDENGQILCMVVEGRDITERVELEQELKKTNRRLRAIQENAPVGVVLGNTDGEVVTWNPKCEEIFEVSREEAIGRKPPFLSGGDEEKIQQVLQTVRSGETIESREIQREKPSGDPITLQYSVAPVQDESGDVSNVVAIFNDVTEKKQTKEQLHEQERIFKKLIENIREAFYLTSLENQEHVYLSSGIEEIWGCAREKLKKSRWAWLDFVHEEDLDRVKRKAKANKPGDIRYRVVQPDGTIRWVRDSSYLIENDEGEPIMVGGICEDITGYKEVQEDLEKSLKEKETLLEELHHRVKNNLQIISSLMTR